MVELDLKKNQYDMKILKQNIYFLNLIEIFKTQKLDAQFIVNYILNPDYQMTQEEEMITMNEVLRFQSHLKREDLLKYTMKYDEEAPNFEKIAFTE